MLKNPEKLRLARMALLTRCVHFDSSRSNGTLNCAVARNQTVDMAVVDQSGQEPKLFVSCPGCEARKWFDTYVTADGLYRDKDLAERLDLSDLYLIFLRRGL